MYPHQTDTVQINAPNYDSDIDGDNLPDLNSKWATVSVQGILDTHQESPVLLDNNSTITDNNATSQNQPGTNWPDAPTIQIPGVSSMTSEQQPEVTHT